MTRAMGGRRGRRRGAMLVEALTSVALLGAFLVPVLGMFGTGVRQARAVKSYTAAQAVASWALADAKGLVDLGLGLEEDGLDLTPDARSALGATAAHLDGFRLERRVRRVAGTAGLFVVSVSVRWVDCGASRRKVVLQEIVRSEV